MSKQKKMIKKGISALVICFIISLSMTIFTYAKDKLSTNEFEELEKAIKLLEETKIDSSQENDTKVYDDVSEDVNYTEKFSLLMIYGPDKRNNSEFKFKVDVKKNNKIEISADGKYGDYGYIWADDYEIYISNKYDVEKFHDRVSYGGNVFTDVNNLLDKLKNVDIKVGDNIRIDSKYYNNTVKFEFEDKTYYTNGSDVHFKGLPEKQYKYAMTEEGFIQQLDKTIIPTGMFYEALLLNVKDKSTGEVSQKKLNFENKSEGRVRFTLDEFGPEDNYVWDENYVIIAYNSDGVLKTGAVLRKGRSVLYTIESVIGAFDRVSVESGDRIMFGTTGDLQSLKLIENSGKYYAEPFLSLFTCTNTNFSNGVNGKTGFFITDYGLMENNLITPKK